MPEQDYPGPTRPMLAAQLRIASEVGHRYVFDHLAAAGFDDLRRSHFDLFRFPGPDGVTPSALAAHLGLSKQALNPLLNELEAMGYLRRVAADPQDRRRRTLVLTARGLELVGAIREALEAFEAEVAQRLGPRRFAQLERSLEELRVLGEERGW